MLLSVTAFMYYCSTFCHHSPTVPCRISCLWRQCCFISAPRMVLEEIPQRPLGGELCRWDGLAMMPGDVMDNQFIPFVNTIKIYTLLPCAVLCCCATVCCGASYHTHSHSHTHTSSKSLLLWLCHPHSQVLCASRSHLPALSRPRHGGRAAAAHWLVPRAVQ